MYRAWEGGESIASIEEAGSYRSKDSNVSPKQLKKKALAPQKIKSDNTLGFTLTGLPMRKKENIFEVKRKKAFLQRSMTLKLMTNFYRKFQFGPGDIVERLIEKWDEFNLRCQSLRNQFEDINQRRNSRRLELKRLRGVEE